MPSADVVVTQRHRNRMVNVYSAIPQRLSCVASLSDAQRRIYVINDSRRQQKEAVGRLCRLIAIPKISRRSIIGVGAQNALSAYISEQPNQNGGHTKRANNSLHSIELCPVMTCRNCCARRATKQPSLHICGDQKCPPRRVQVAFASQSPSSWPH